MNKYRNKRCEFDGIKFDSVKEMMRYRELKILSNLHFIKDLRLQVPYVLIPKNDNGSAVKYIADFVYIQDGKTVVEDVKGMRLPLYKLKKRLMKEVHGIDIKEY